MKRISPFYAVGTFLLLSSCCSLVNGPKQSIGFASSPVGAKVTVDGIPIGMTPVTRKLERSEDHVVVMELKGYCSFSATVTHSVSGWVWGNLICGPLGLAIDACTGSLYVLSPEQVQAQLAVESRHAFHDAPQEDRLHFFVVLKPDPAWRKAGQMRRS